MCTVDGIGQVFGSALGGSLSTHIGGPAVSIVAGCMCLVCVLVNALGLPPSSSTRTEAASPSQSLNISQLYTVLSKNRRLLLFLAFQTLLGFGMSLFYSQFSIIMRDSLKMDAAAVGHLHACTAVVRHW